MSRRGGSRSGRNRKQPTRRTNPPQKAPLRWWNRITKTILGAGALATAIAAVLALVLPHLPSPSQENVARIISVQALSPVTLTQYLQSSALSPTQSADRPQNQGPDLAVAVIGRITPSPAPDRTASSSAPATASSSAPATASSSAPATASLRAGPPLVRAGHRLVVRARHRLVVRAGHRLVVRARHRLVVRAGDRLVVRAGHRLVVRARDRLVVRAGHRLVVRAGHRLVVRAATASSSAPATASSSAPATASSSAPATASSSAPVAIPGASSGGIMSVLPAGVSLPAACLYEREVVAGVLRQMPWLFIPSGNCPLMPAPQTSPSATASPTSIQIGVCLLFTTPVDSHGNPVRPLLLPKALLRFSAKPKRSV